jgi:hypothetical protein
VKLNFDVDIDVGNRELILEKIKHVPASMRNITPIRKHASGIYPCNIPYDPINAMAAISYETAEERGYFKLDILNVHVYEKVKSEEHLISLMCEPDWSMLNERKTVEQLIHLNGQFDNIRKMPEPIDSIPRLAMFLAVIRPAKRHLIGKTWQEVNKTVWDKGSDGYSFKKSHAVGYGNLVAVHMNLIKEEQNGS